MLIADPWQRRGLGSELLRRLIQVARDEKLARVTANVLPENREMQGMLERLGFRVALVDDGQMLAAELPLEPAPRAA